MFRAFLLVFALYPIPSTPYPVFAARSQSAAFSEVNGGFSYGTKYGYSSSFEFNAGVQELAVSTAQAPSFSLRSGALALYPQPSPVTDLALVTASSYSLRVSWTSPAADWYRGSGGVEKYILRYTTAAPILTDVDFASARDAAQSWTPIGPGLRDTRLVEGFDPGTTYYFAVESANEHLLRSELSNPFAVFAVVPLAPVNFRLTFSTASVSMSWICPAGFANRMPFNDRFNPVYPYEIRTYQVFRATAPANAEWTPLGPELSSDTLNWTDIAGAGQEFYYHVKARNQAGFSPPSYIRGNTGPDLYFIAADNTSLIEIPGGALADFVSDDPNPDPLGVYTLEITSHAEDLAGRVLKSVEFSAYKGGMERDEKFKLSTPATMKVYYRKSGGVIVPSAANAAAGIGLYYYNGSKWVQVYGRVDDARNRMELKTALLGRYQIRSVERALAFSPDISGLSNRLITPNGDGKNDTMVFVFDNPLEASFEGRIYDLKGALVAKMTPTGPVADSLVWDAKAGGRTVSGGVYIYQIESGGNVYNGTVAVIR